MPNSRIERLPVLRSPLSDFRSSIFDMNQALYAISLITAWTVAVPLPVAGTPQQEEAADYYAKWLNEDVVYIITDEEREVFLSLSTDEEKENFIEQFWRRRDPDPQTAVNEFKEEHYRRIAYANEHFASGLPGWRTDRGRVYIIHGPPDAIEESFGGPYVRPIYEGGGTTATFPYQVWRYRHIEGLGDDIELEFVDTTLTGDYKLTNDPWEKDAFAHVPGIGLTLAEERGLARKSDRFILNGMGDYYPLLAQRYQDKPFVRLERYAGIMRPPSVRFTDLKRAVDVKIHFYELPFRVHTHYFRLNPEQAIVPLTLEIPNRELTFQEQESVRIARIAVYGVVQTLGGLVVKEFEDEFEIRLPAGDPKPLNRTSLYQKLLVLQQGERFKASLVLKDLESGKVGVTDVSVAVPAFGTEELQVSSLLLADTLVPVDEAAADRMFVLGNLLVRPKVDKRFPRQRLMVAYLQLYNVGVDQATLRPNLELEFLLQQDGRDVARIEDRSGDSIRFISIQRVVVTRVFSPAQLAPGTYELVVRVRDQITGQERSVRESFEIVSAVSGVAGGSAGR
ncbi:MAG: hypothetical protein Kow00109_09480 [Acidobacteriota bacterium]